MFGGLKSIRRERAALERDRVVLGTMMEDAEVAEAVESMDTDFFEGVTSDEIDELIDRLPESDDEDAQVDKILNSKEDMSVDEISGVDNVEADLSDI